jgi:hypothetical protein
MSSPGDKSITEEPGMERLSQRDVSGKQSECQRPYVEENPGPYYAPMPSHRTDTASGQQLPTRELRCVRYRDYPLSNMTNNLLIGDYSGDPGDYYDIGVWLKLTIPLIQDLASRFPLAFEKRTDPGRSMKSCPSGGTTTNRPKCGASPSAVGS